MEGFENKYHLWMVYNAWNLGFSYISSSQVDLLDFRSHEVAFHG
jgi:hypothetical protein